MLWCPYSEGSGWTWPEKLFLEFFGAWPPGSGVYLFAIYPVNGGQKPEFFNIVVEYPV